MTLRIVPRRFRALAQRLLNPWARCTVAVRELLCNRRGLEVGGPSSVFRWTGILPIYPVVGALDNCLFSGETFWATGVREGRTFRYHPRRHPGQQYIAEASALDPIPDATYEFVLSSHTLEHVANPLKALREWMRVLKPGGTLVLMLPHRDATFDRRRPVTTIAHLRDDERQRVGEDDPTHVREILELHDLTWDTEPGGLAAFQARAMSNPTHRSLHHHVFDTRLAVEAIDAVGMQLLFVEALRPLHILLVATKPNLDGRVSNAAWLDSRARYRRRSPFPSDRS